MHPTLLDRRDIAGFRRRLTQGLDHLETNVPVSSIDAAVERTLFHRRRAQAALARINNGVYGLCCQCAAEIEVDRLQHDPAAPFCMACQQERDAAR